MACKQLIVFKGPIHGRKIATTLAGVGFHSRREELSKIAGYKYSPIAGRESQLKEEVLVKPLRVLLVTSLLTATTLLHAGLITRITLGRLLMRRGLSFTTTTRISTVIPSAC
jgi:hypothetical protein